MDVLSGGKVRWDFDTVNAAIFDKFGCHEPLAGFVFAFFPELDPGVVARGVLGDVDETRA